MANPTSNTGTNPTQDQPDDLMIMGIMIHRREQFEAAYEYWRGQIGAVDDDGEAILAMLAMRQQWREITAALDRRIGGRLL